MCFRVDPRPPEREREKKKTGTKVCGDRSTDRVDVEQICRQFIDLSGLKQAGSRQAHVSNFLHNQKTFFLSLSITLTPSLSQ